MGKGLSSYQAYTITSVQNGAQKHEVRSTNQQVSARKLRMQVQRRYSDFVWLRETLAKEYVLPLTVVPPGSSLLQSCVCAHRYLGAVVPPVPPKGMGGIGMSLVRTPRLFLRALVIGVNTT